MISCIVQRKGRDCFCSTLLSLSCSLFVKVNMPRRETEQELRIWPSDVAAQLEPMLWRAVPRNTAPSQMKSLGLLSGSEIAGAHESLLCWLWKYCVQHHCSRKCKSHGLSCTRCRMLWTHNLMPRQTLEANREGFHSLERVVALESCST